MSYSYSQTEKQQFVQEKVNRFIHQIDTLDMFIQSFQHQLDQFVKQAEYSKDYVIQCHSTKDKEDEKNKSSKKNKHQTNTKNENENENEFTPPTIVPDLIKTSYFEYKHPFHTLSKTLQHFINNELHKTQTSTFTSTYSYTDIIHLLINYIEQNKLMDDNEFYIKPTQELITLFNLDIDIDNEHASSNILTFFNIHHYLLSHFPVIE
jgi:hypothetical protein